MTEEVTNQTEEEGLDEQPNGDESRRSFMKKGAVATGAVALGLGAAGSAAAQDGGTVLVQANDFIPGAQFSVTGQLPNSLTIDLLQGGQGRDLNVVQNPGDYQGYVIRYTETPTALYAMMFVDPGDVGNVSEGSTWTFGTEGANYFADQLNLVEASISQGGSNNGG
ncbi:twin-arginine translocation signal domain-containing protein [Halegenticoccus soli]|uniref:twin-arginine translocation signal domain-containing protein n=1 Tax=Halegenticoccus soli TaxID=1985678 RepID=UPI000C6D86D3|nr:twin-arginine translocation signal domain-containing protein [Halegenticoccus soli]